LVHLKSGLQVKFLERRQFLKTLGLLGLGSVLSQSLLSGCRAPQQQDRVKPSSGPIISGWTGDNFAPMHRVRDGELKASVIPKPSLKKEVVIVGGGISGLVAAHELRDTDFLLLERENTLGGNSKQGSYEGVPYSLGAAYVVDLEAPFGPLYEALGLPLTPLKEPADCLFENHQFFPPEKASIAKEFERLKKQLATLSNTADFPGVPIREASATALKLDNKSFYDALKYDYSQPMLDCIDAYCYSALGGGIHEISAYAGMNFYSEINVPKVAFPGGNAAVAQRLVQKIEQAGRQRFETGVSVYHVEKKGASIHTTFFRNEAPDVLVTVESKAVLLAVPLFFAARMLHGLSEKESTQMKQTRYGSYLVANCCFDRTVLNAGYDHWTPHSSAFTDVIDAGYAGRTSSPVLGTKEPSVLTVYAPFKNPSLGRGRLLQGDAQTLGNEIHQALKKTIDFPAESLKEIRLTRYGHQLLTSKVGIIQAMRTLPLNYGNIFLAHSDTEGMASIESAILAGMSSVKRLKWSLTR
jgi:protoporphyrinogen oxidase